MDNVRIFIQLVALAIVPVAAFLIRMVEGDTRNENEVVISRVVQNAWVWLKSKITTEGVLA